MTNQISASVYEADTTPFASAEEAWFWFSICQKLRNQYSGKNNESGLVVRACTPDDIYRIVMALHRKRRLESYHLQVLGVYGDLLVPPDPYLEHEATDARLWAEALDYLEEELISKGLVE